MRRSKKTGRRILLAIGVVVGILIFFLGSQLNANLNHAERHEIKNVQTKEPNPIIKKLFS